MQAQWRECADIVEEVRGNQSFHALERWIRLERETCFWRLAMAAEAAANHRGVGVDTALNLGRGLINVTIYGRRRA